MITHEMTSIVVHRFCSRTKDIRGLEIAGLPSPQTVGQANHGETTSVFKVGPDDWLVLQKTPQDTLGLDHNDDFIVFEESGAWRLLRLNKDRADDVVSRLSPIDLHGARSGGFGCLTTHLAGHPVILILRSGGDIDVMVRRSYASSLIALIDGDVSCSTNATQTPPR